MKSMTQNSVPVSGSWTHSFEEDEPGVLVYRPTHAYAFPPSRQGRETLHFGDDGQLTALAPGPDDRPLAKPAQQLKPMGMNRFALIGAIEGTPQSSTPEIIEVIEATPAILKLARH